MCVRDYGNQISIFAFGAKSWGISFSNQIHKRELHEFYILEQWPRAMECYQKFSQPKIFTQNQSSIMRQTTQNIVSRNEKWKIQKKWEVKYVVYWKTCKRASRATEHFKNRHQKWSAKIEESKVNELKKLLINIIFFT